MNRKYDFATVKAFFASQGCKLLAKDYQQSNLSSFAHRLDIGDFVCNIEDGVSEDTVIIYGNVPVKYLKFL